MKIPEKNETRKIEYKKEFVNVSGNECVCFSAKCKLCGAEIIDTIPIREYGKSIEFYDHAAIGSLGKCMKNHGWDVDSCKCPECIVKNDSERKEFSPILGTPKDFPIVSLDKIIRDMHVEEEENK